MKYRVKGPCTVAGVRPGGEVTDEDFVRYAKDDDRPVNVGALLSARLIEPVPDKPDKPAADKTDKPERSAKNSEG